MGDGASDMNKAAQRLFVDHFLPRATETATVIGVAGRLSTQCVAPCRDPSFMPSFAGLNPSFWIPGYF
jgi:hypothetical protein